MKLTDIKYEESCILSECEIMEMARVREADSGIAVEIYVSTGQSVNGRHGPRIKVSNIKNTFSDSDNFAIDIAKEPRIVAGKVKLKTSEIDDILDWIKLNYDPLLKYWNNSYNSDSQFFKEIKPLK